MTGRDSQNSNLDTFNVVRVHNGAFEKLDFGEMSFEQRFQLQLRSTTDNACNTMQPFSRSRMYSSYPRIKLQQYFASISQ